MECVRKLLWNACDKDCLVKLFGDACRTSIHQQMVVEANVLCVSKVSGSRHEEASLSGCGWHLPITGRVRVTGVTELGRLKEVKVELLYPSGENDPQTVDALFIAPGLGGSSVTIDIYPRVYAHERWRLYLDVPLEEGTDPIVQAQLCMQSSIACGGRPSNVTPAALEW